MSYRRGTFVKPAGYVPIGRPAWAGRVARGPSYVAPKVGDVFPNMLGTRPDYESPYPEAMATAPDPSDVFRPFTTGIEETPAQPAFQAEQGGFDMGAQSSPVYAVSLPVEAPAAPQVPNVLGTSTDYGPSVDYVPPPGMAVAPAPFIPGGPGDYAPDPHDPRLWSPPPQVGSPLQPNAQAQAPQQSPWNWVEIANVIRQRRAQGQSMTVPADAWATWPGDDFVRQRVEELAFYQTGLSSDEAETYHSAFLPEMRRLMRTTSQNPDRMPNDANESDPVPADYGFRMAVADAILGMSADGVLRGVPAGRIAGRTMNSSNYRGAFVRPAGRMSLRYAGRVARGAFDVAPDPYGREVYGTGLSEDASDTGFSPAPGTSLDARGEMTDWQPVVGQPVGQPLGTTLPPMDNYLGTPEMFPGGFGESSPGTQMGVAPAPFIPGETKDYAPSPFAPSVAPPIAVGTPVEAAPYTVEDLIRDLGRGNERGANIWQTAAARLGIPLQVEAKDCGTYIGNCCVVDSGAPLHHQAWSQFFGSHYMGDRFVYVESTSRDYWDTDEWCNQSEASSDIGSIWPEQMRDYANGWRGPLTPPGMTPQALVEMLLQIGQQVRDAGPSPVVVAAGRVAGRGLVPPGNRAGIASPLRPRVSAPRRAGCTAGCAAGRVVRTAGEVTTGSCVDSGLKNVGILALLGLAGYGIYHYRGNIARWVK